MQTPQVAIIGAGPTGLLAAINLVKNKISVRIFESRSERSQLSRALAVHAGTLELLEAAHPDLLGRFLKRGKKIRRLNIANKYFLDASKIPSKFNFILGLEQEETEEILEDYLSELGCKVERGCALVDAATYDNKATAVIKKGGEEFIVTCDYIIDCSGAHSVIRKNVLKLPFEGEKYFGRLVMGDVKIFSGLKNDEGYLTGTDKGFAAFLPLTDEPHFRVIMIPHFDAKIPEKISIEYFRDLAKKLAPHIELSEENKWLTSFELSKRVVSKLRVARIFLAGDAAHIHSPVGGQGMNLGMQDALNISNKIKRVLIDREDEKILDDYEKERMPVIKAVLRRTNAAMKSGVEKTWMSRLVLFCVRKIFAPILFSSDSLQFKMLTQVSMIESARREITRMKY